MKNQKWRWFVDTWHDTLKPIARSLIEALLLHNRDYNWGKVGYTTFIGQGG